MIDINQNAQRIGLLFHYGVITGDEVIGWADSLIAGLDSPPDSLLELSTIPPGATADILSCLHRLSAGADFWPAFRSALPRLREYIVSYPDRAEGIANHLFLTACRFAVSDLPDDLHFICRFDDAFSLARDGTYGNTGAVYQEFIYELEKFP